MRRLAIGSCAVSMAMLASALFAGVAPAEHVQCGAQIKQDTRLDSDIIDCSSPSAIWIVKPDVSLDLGGHTVDGTGAGSGVRASTPRAAVFNGRIQQFRAGVSNLGGNGMVARDLVLTENLRGIVVLGQARTLIERITAFGNTTGISLGDITDAIVRNNEVFANQGSGILGGYVRSSLFTGNDSHHNAYGMSWTTLLDSRVERNRLTGNGLVGFRADDLTRNVLSSNDVSNNGQDGILLVSDYATQNVLEQNHAHGNGDDGIDVDREGNTLTHNFAFDNGDLGIEAVAGTIDGGKNKAHGNGNPAQCIGVSCK